jgi:FkbM family methyltransferase
MQFVSRKLPFVLASTSHGTMIVSHLDHHADANGVRFGVGYQLLETSMFDAVEVTTAAQMLGLRRKHHGDGVVAIDCGANIGVHTVEWAIAMTGWGRVVAIEAQERVYYALAGNIAINNCFNASAIHAAVASQSGVMKMPQPDYFQASTLGSLELRQGPRTEFIGQQIDYSDAAAVQIRAVALDDLDFDRVDLIKIDVEGMEIDALDGAKRLIEKHRPIVLVEHLKTGVTPLMQWLSPRGYHVVQMGLNLLAIHESDPIRAQIQVAGDAPKA